MPAPQSWLAKAVNMSKAASNVRLTENGATAFASTTNPLLDFFFDVMQGTSTQVIHERLDAAWNVHALNTLKLVFNLRNVREGKSAKEEFYQCLLWLHQHHPATLKANLQHVPAHGYWKDLCNLLLLVAYDGETPQPPRVVTPFVKERDYAVRLVLPRSATPDVCVDDDVCEESRSPHRGEAGEDRRSPQRGGESVSGDGAIAEDEDWVVLKKPRVAGRDAWAKRVENFARQRVYALVKKGVWRRFLRSLPVDEQGDAKEYFHSCAVQYARKFQQDMAEVRREKRAEYEVAVSELRQENAAFEELYQEVVYLFAAALKSDVVALAANKRLPEGRLAGKWAPSPGLSHDKYLGLAVEIAKKLCMAGKDGEVSRAVHSAQEVLVTDQQMLDVYRHQYLNPLRQYICSPERYMSANLWHQLPYNRVPSVAMTRYTELFAKHDNVRFRQFLQQVKSGKKKIASGALLPHQIVSSILSSRCSEITQEVLELQWASYVKSIKDGGVLENALAICDVSGSMHGTPMQAAIALSLLLAEICSPPFNQHVCTFSATPCLQSVDQPSLYEKVTALEQMDWDMNTNLQAVFDLLLSLAKKVNLPPAEMIKTLFIFSDMEFDECVQGGGKTDLQLAREKFEAAGYLLPTIVFWNLRGGDRSKPAVQNEEGVAMMSGFSGKMIKWFLSGNLIDQMQQMTLEQQAKAEAAEQKAQAEAKLTPIDKLQQILDSELYAALTVVD